MINVHPSDQLQKFTEFMSAWVIVSGLLLALAVWSGRTAVGLALGIMIGGALVLVRKGYLKGPGAPSHG